MIQVPDCGEDKPTTDENGEIELDVTSSGYAAMVAVVKEILTGGEDCCVRHRADRICDAIFVMSMNQESGAEH